MILIDTREHKSELLRITRQLNSIGVEYELKKLDVGDYMKVGRDDLSIDRKKDLIEICGNVTQQHERFQRELMRAQAKGIKLIILCEHGGEVKCLEDVYFWQNPRLEYSPRATTGKQLFKSLCTMRDRYGIEFVFCTKKETGKRIAELLGEKDGH